MSKNTIPYLAGKHLYYAFIAGAKRILEEQQYLNKINVFPVPDGDTGTNMASTVQAIVDSMTKSENIKETAMSIADAALVGARGNSGIIFAQFIYGTGSNFPDQASLAMQEFLHAVKKGVRLAYESIANPVEGTIITVLRKWSDALEVYMAESPGYVEWFERCMPTLKEALEATRKELPKLLKAKVVDSGAQAFVFFIEGIVEFVRNDGDLKELAFTRSKTVGIHEESTIDHEEITFRFCTEALITITLEEDFELNDIRKLLARLGDSIVIAGSKTRMRVHIHTDSPPKVFTILSRYGTIDFQKVDDMEFQQEITLGKHPSIGLMVDSTADLPKEVRIKHQMHLIPLNLLVGKSQYLDRITITSNQFYRMLRKMEKSFPTTSQPSKKEFINKYSFMCSNYDSIISLSVSSQLSGTYQNSREAADTIAAETGKRISSIDTCCCSGTLGLVAQLTAEGIEQGLNHDELLERIASWTSKARIYVSTKSIKFFMRSGRLSASKGLIANMLNLRPVVSMDAEGRGTKLGSYRGRKGCLKRSVSQFRDHVNQEGVDRYCVCYTDQAEIHTAIEVAKTLEDICGFAPAYLTQLSPVLGTIGGNGAIVIAVILK